MGLLVGEMRLYLKKRQAYQPRQAEQGAIDDAGLNGQSGIVIEREA
ncbi:hypothetical protein ACFVHQ_18165 [Actinomycetes bacterium NPDC127524]